jgi:hypothetical protein
MNEPIIQVPARIEPRERSLTSVPNPDATPMQMLAIMTQRGVSMADLKDMIALAKDWEANQARKAFNEVKILKRTQVKDGPLKGKFHANLFDVVDGTTPFLSKHALAISWKLSKDEPTWMEVTCTLRHALGHSESVSMGGAPDTGPGRNAIQSRGSTKSYLERYTATAILGLAAQDMDDDGNGSPQVATVSDEQIANIQALIEEVSADKAKLLTWLKVESLSQIRADAYTNVVRMLEAKRK